MADKTPDKGLELARRYAAGGRVGYARGGPPEWKDPTKTGTSAVPDILDSVMNAIVNEGQRSTPYMDPKMRRQIANRSLAGRDLTYEQMQALADAEAANEERPIARVAEVIGAVVPELTGVPSMIRGGTNVMRGYEEGDPYRVAGGALEGALGAVPAGIMLRPLGRALAPIAGTIPRYAATSALASGLTAYSDDAKAAEKNAATAIASDPEIQALNAAKERALSRMSFVNEQHKRSGPETQRQALKPYQDEIALINDKIKAAEDRARSKFMDQATFREKYPGVPAAMYTGALGMAAGLPFAKTVGERVMDRFSRRPAIERATEKAGNAFAAGLPDAETAAAQDILRRKLERWDANHSGMGVAGKYLGAMGTGALMGSEASTLPEQIDLITNEPGHPAREKAVEAMMKPSYWSERLGPALLGGAAGMTGVKLAKTIPGNTEFLDAAREVASRGETPSMLSRLMGRISGPSEEAMQRVRRYRELAGPGQSSADAKIIEGLAGKPLEGGSLSRMPTSPPEVIPPSLPAAPPPSALPVPSLSPADAANLEKVSSRLTDLTKGQKLTPNIPEWASAPPEGVKLNKGYHWDPNLGRQRHADGTLGETPRYVTPRKALGDVGKKKVYGDDVPAKPTKEFDPNDPINRGRAYGGRAEDPSMDLIRKYASGGKVAVGGIVGDTGGREDAKPVKVPNGSYVVSADVVSALGGNNTLSGLKRLGEMFGKPQEKYASGGAIPIQISDGEFVVTPEQVAQLGGGDMERGHRMLEAWSMKVRQHHIATLKGLPPPAR